MKRFTQIFYFSNKNELIIGSFKILASLNLMNVFDLKEVRIYKKVHMNL